MEVVACALEGDAACHLIWWMERLLFWVRKGSLIYLGEPVNPVAEGENLAAALAQEVATKEGDAVLQSAENENTLNEAEVLLQTEAEAPDPGVDLERIAEIAAANETVNVSDLEFEDDTGPSFILYNEDVINEGGGGGVETIYEPAIYAPEGYSGEDLYAIEFVHNESTGEMVIYLYFGADPLASPTPRDASLLSGAAQTLGLTSDPGLGDIVPLQQARSCTITITRTTTQNSGSYTVNFNTGVVNGSRTSPSSSVTTTTSVSVQGTLINGRCVVRR